MKNISSIVSLVYLPSNSRFYREMSLSFNASLEVTEVVLRSLENVSKELAKRCILECALRHNFDGDEELRILGLDNVTVILKKKPIIKQKPVITDKPKFCLPFLASSVDENGCNGIAFNEGLYTQCKKVRIENETFCKMCLGESKVSWNGEPKNGTVQRRSNSPYYSYEDSRGRMPPSYQDYMKKRGITQEDVLAEAEKQGLTIPLEHFASFSRSKKMKLKVVKKSKKSVIFEEDEEKEDLFAKVNDLLEETLEDLSEDVVLDEYEQAQKEAEKEAEREAKLVQKALEKAEQKAEREAKAALEKVEREAKLALEKAEKAAEREAKKAQEKAAREEKLALEKAEREAKIAKKAQEKAEREARLEQEKVEKAAKLAQDKADAKAAREAKLAEEKAARETKLAEEKAAREAKKAQEKADKEAQKTVKKPVEKPVEKVVEKPAEDTAPKKVTVKRLFYNGKQYLKSGENVLYDPDTKEEVGIWCEQTQTILDLPDDFYEDESDDEEN